MAVQINRNPFSRETLVRQISDRTFQTCDWCGSHRHYGGQVRPDLGLFVYGTEPDSTNGRINWQDHEFCGIGCMEAYNS